MTMNERVRLAYRNGTFAAKAREFMRSRISAFSISIPYRLLLGMRPRENMTYYENWKFYYVLRYMMRRTLRSLPPFVSPSGQPPKTIWWCWLQGEENAPELCRACLASLRRHLPEFKITIVTEKNMWNFVSIPDFIRKKYEAGIISRTHFSDILRTCLLCEHGGTWIDATVYCTGYRSDVLSLPLFYFSNVKRGDKGIALSNWLISSCGNHPFLLSVRALLFAWWKRHDRLYHYFQYHFFATMVLERFGDALRVPVFSNVPPHIMQDELFLPFSPERFAQYALMSDFHKLTYKFAESHVSDGTLYEKLVEEEK